MRRASRIALVAALVAAVPARAFATEQNGGTVPRGELHGELSATPLFALGVLPSAAAGFGAAMSFRGSLLSLGVEPRVLYALAARDIGGGASVSTGVTMGILRLCGHP